MEEKNKMKGIIYLSIGIITLVSLILGATYAYFKAVIGNEANANINATTSTTNNLTFSTEGDIVLNVTAENLKNGGNDLSDTAIARARLIKSNTSESATAHYNIYLLIEENELEYSSYTQEVKEELRFMTKEEKENVDLEGYTGVPELILSVKKGETEYEITKRLTPTEGGYDITEADGLYAIGENVEIISDEDVTDTWEVKVTFKNLEYNQQLNTGKSLKGKIIITAEKLLYEINDADELRQLSTEVNAGDTKEGKYYVLTNNIDLGPHEEEVSNFTPIGTDSNRFKGNFNGDNHTISNLYMNGIENAGLFGYVENASVSNLIVNGDIVNATNAGGLLCYTYGDVMIDNVHNYVVIRAQVNGSIGGIVAIANNNLIIKDSANKVNITNNNSSYIGGLVGKSNTNTSMIKIINSHNEGAINNENNYTTSIVGGIIGRNDGDTDINDSYNIGNITVNGENDKNIGGLVGYANNIAFTNCYNKSTISTTNKDSEYSSILGGIVGYVYGKGHISSTFNLGNINGGARAGGIVGIIINKGNTLLINKCYNLGNIKTINGSYTWNYAVGGIVGVIRITSITYILNSYNFGEIIANPSTNDGYVGGIIGDTIDGGQNERPFGYNKIYNSYNLGNITGKNVFTNGITLSTSENIMTINNVYNIGIIENVSSPTKIYGIGIFNENYASIANAYFKDDILGSNINGTIPMKIENMKTSSFIDTLNNNIDSIDINSIKEELIASGAIDNNYDLTLDNWKLGEDGYPTLDF